MMAVLVMGCLSAQSVIVTATGTVDSTADGYTAGQPVMFSFGISDFAELGTNYPTSIEWREYRDGPNLFAAVGGTGITGQFIKPNSGDTVDYQSWLTVSGENTLNVRFWYGSSIGDTGLDANGNELRMLSFTADLTGLDWGVFPTTPTAVSFLSSFGGTYAATPIQGFMYTDGPIGSVAFTITGVTINTSAIPEPSAFAALAGLMALGFAGCRRRPRC